MALQDSKKKTTIEAALNDFEEMIEESEQKRKEKEFLEKSKDHLEEITLRDRTFSYVFKSISFYLKYGGCPQVRDSFEKILDFYEFYNFKQIETFDYV